MKIYCSRCHKEQKPDEYFSRTLPHGETQPIYICERCEKELGGKDETLAWVLDYYFDRLENKESDSATGEKA